MEARFLHEGRAVDYTPSEDVPAGTVVVTGYLIGITLRDISANQLGALQVMGVFDIAKAAGDGGITGGSKVYWNLTDKVATKETTSGGETPIPFPYMGKAIETAGDTDVVVKVRLEQ